MVWKNLRQGDAQILPEPGIQSSILKEIIQIQRNYHVNGIPAQFLHILPCIFIKTTNINQREKAGAFFLISFEHQYFPAVNCI